MLIKRLMLVAGIALAAFVTGCAHPISVTADMAQIKGSGAKVNKTVGYYIAPEDRTREVITPGGGGDKVSYVPYRDLEPAIYKAMSEVFTNVVKLDTPADAAKLAKDNVQFVITPKITTNSSSSSMLTWPPTQFTIDMSCKVSDKSGASLKEFTATGTGRAEFSEFKSDFSLSAKRAAQQAMANLVKALEAHPEFRQ
jgi:hypothetical protein